MDKNTAAILNSMGQRLYDDHPGTPVPMLIAAAFTMGMQIALCDPALAKRILADTALDTAQHTAAADQAAAELAEALNG